MDSGMIIYKYGKPSPLTILGLGLLGGIAAFLALPFLIVFVVILCASAAYMTWRLRRVLETSMRDQGSDHREFHQHQWDDAPDGDFYRGVIIDITPEEPRADNHSKVTPSITS